MPAEGSGNKDKKYNTGNGKQIGGGGGKRIAQVKITYQMHCLNRKTEKSLVLESN